MTLEQNANPQDRREVVAPFPTLEHLFDTKNAAQLVMLESAGNGHKDTRVGIDALADKYAGVFGKNRTPRKRRETVSISDFVLEDKEYAKPGDSFVMEMVRGNEARFMARVLLSPSKDPEQVQQRQELIGRLATSEHLDELIDLKDQTWKVFEGLWEFRVIHGNYRWEETSLIEHYYGGTKSIPILENEYDRNSTVIKKYDVMKLVGKAVDTVNQGLAGFAKFGEAFAGQEDPYIRQAFGGIPADIAKLKGEMDNLIPFDKKPATKTSEYPDEKSDELKALVKKIEPYFFSQSAVLEFAKKVRDEGWQPVSFDKTQPYGYTGGWSLEELKSEQMPNDSPSDTPITILSGANTSGKSFTMRSDFFIRVSAQSVGFAPVRSGNLPHFENFLYLDRAATDSQSDLSAFMREVENWKLALSDVGANTRMYVDEGYSTTSPDAQANLLLATAGYIKDRGGSVMLATHNDLVLDAAEQDPDMQVYNLRTEVGATGELRRFFKLQAGRSESLSFAVAQAKQFPEPALTAARAYIESGKINPEVVIVADYPRIAMKSSEKREEEKQLPSSLDSLFPDKPVNPAFHLFSLDNDMRPHGFLWNLGREIESQGVSDSHELLNLLGEMVLWQPVQSPEDVLERQRLFEELTKDDIFQVIPTLTGDIGLIEETVAVIGAHTQEGVNKGLNPFSLSDEQLEEVMRKITTRTELQQFKSMLQAADAYLRIHTKMFGSTPEISEAQDRYEIMGNVIDAVSQRTNSYNKASLTEAEKEDVVLATEGIVTVKNEMTAVDLQKAVLKMITISLRSIDSDVPAAGVWDIPIKDITEELDVLETYHRGGEERIEHPRKSGMLGNLAGVMDIKYGGLPMALQRIPGMIDNEQLLVQALKGTDSVYLHQLGNLIDGQLKKHRAVISGSADTATEDEIQSTMPDAKSRFNHLGERYDLFSLGRREEKKTPFKTALKRTEALAMFASIAKDQGLTKVTFNDTGEIRLKNAASIFKVRKEEIANDIVFSPDSTRVQLLTGPNGSGKTFYEKGAVASILLALATGYAPAEDATMPVFDAVTYLDRVVEKQDKSYSSFSQEVEYWKELLKLLPNKKAVFAAVDEAFSTTSPGYQAAFSAAVVGEVLRSPHFLMLSTHNHDAVSSLVDSKLSLVKPYNFAFDVQDQKIKYQYRLQEGHETSHAIEVARTMGLPEEILLAAQK